MTETILNNETRDLLKRTKGAGLTDDQFAMFCHAIDRFRLDPFGNQIYAVVRGSKRGPALTIQTGIDGYRLIADRTNAYAGNDDPIFIEGAEHPDAATVTVYKMVSGQRCPFTATARWDEYYPGDRAGAMWKSKPHVMLGKCAEALALRKAFPAELSGLYTTEEMQQADTEVITTANEPVAANPAPVKKAVSLDYINKSKPAMRAKCKTPAEALTRLAQNFVVTDEAKALVNSFFEAEPVQA